MSGNATAVAPMLVLVAGILAVLLVDTALKGRRRVLGRTVTPEWSGALLSLVSGAALAIAGVVAAQNFVTGETHVFRAAAPRLSFDRFASWTVTWICLAGLLTTLQAFAYLVKRGLCRGESFALSLASILGSVLALCSEELVTTFVGLELAALPLVANAGLDRHQLRSNEAALKLAVAGGFAAGLTAFGIALVYGASGATHYDAIRAALDPADPLGMLGVALILVGVAFRALLVPLHAALADVIDGAPASTGSFLAVIGAATALWVGLRLVQVAFGPLGDALRWPIVVLATASMCWGPALALTQERTRRVLAGIAIGQAGTLVVGWGTGGAGAAAMLFAVPAAGFALLGAFGGAMTLAGRGGEADRIADFDGLARERPVLAAAMALFLLSLAGIPGSVGFVARFEIWSAAFASGSSAFAVALGVGSVLGLLACLRIPIALYARARSTGERRPGTAGAEVLVLSACAVAVLVLGWLPNGGPGLEWLRALDWSRDAAALFATAPFSAR